MKKTVLLLLILTFPTSVFAQKFYLKDSNTKEVIPYAHIALVNGVTGMYSNQDGSFELRENSDSLYISHVSYKDTIIATQRLTKTIYLLAAENQLKTIDIYPKKKKKISIKKKNKMGFNFYSFAVGTAFLKRNYKEWNVLSEIRIPIKLGKDTPLVRINIYRFNLDSGRPSVVLWSALLEDQNYQKNEILLKNLSLNIENEAAIFVSIDVISYNINDLNGHSNTPPYTKHKDMIRLWTRTREDSYGLIKNHYKAYNEWVSFSTLYSTHSDIEPIIQVDIE